MPRTLATATAPAPDAEGSLRHPSAPSRAIRDGDPSRIPKAALFELYEDDGFRSAFEQLVACILSIRTFDEASIVAARRLLGRARTPAAMAALDDAEIDALISNVTFHEGKARQIRGIAQPGVRGIRRRGAMRRGDHPLLPRRRAEVREPRARHRVRPAPHRRGHPRPPRRRTAGATSPTSTPEKTMAALITTSCRKEFWVEINRLLVPFGKHICTGLRPKCSTCPVLSMCPAGRRGRTPR